MKRPLLLFGFIVVGVAAGVFGAVAYSWSQATRLPDWYTQSTATNPATLDIEAAQARVVRNLTTQSNSPAEVAGALNASEFNELLVAAIASDPNLSPVLQGTRSLNTQIDNGELAVGGVINLSEVPIERLGTEGQTVIQQAIRTFPALANQDIFVGIEGQPRIIDGQLQLSDQTTLRVGNLRFTLGQLEGMLGIPRSQLEQRLTLELQQGGLEINTIEFVGDRAQVEGIRR